MTATRATHSKRILAAVAGAAVLGGAVTWLSNGVGGPEKAARGTPFWSWITPHASELNVPQSVDDIAKRSDAIVVAHVTDVVEGREERGYTEPTPGDPRIPLPRTVFVQLTVDRVVRGSVAEQQVLNMEMYRPPRPLTIEDVRKDIPPGQLLVFLANRAAGAKRSGFTSPVIQLQEKDIWAPVSLSRAVVAQGPDGLYSALQPWENASSYLRSFQASTLEAAAERAARAPR